MGFVAIGFEHRGANMDFIPVGIFLARWSGLAPEGIDVTTLTWRAFFLKNLIPVTIGNTIGGGWSLLEWLIGVLPETFRRCLSKRIETYDFR